MVDPAALKDFEREMTETVIPAITKAMQERAILAEDARRGRLPLPAGPQENQEGK